MASADKYDIKHDKWTPLPDLNVARKSHSSCNMTERQKIYVFGGYNETGLICSLEQLDWSGVEIIDRFGVIQTCWRLI